MHILNDIGRIIPVPDMMVPVAVIFMQSSKQTLGHTYLLISGFFLALLNFNFFYDTISCHFLAFVFLVFLLAILTGDMSFFISVVTLFLSSRSRRKHHNLETMGLASVVNSQTIICIMKKQWNRLPNGDVEDTPSQEAFKDRMDGALSNLI